MSALKPTLWDRVKVPVIFLVIAALAYGVLIGTGVAPKFW